jgi:hypothetical protein
VKVAKVNGRNGKFTLVEIVLILFHNRSWELGVLPGSCVAILRKS